MSRTTLLKLIAIPAVVIVVLLGLWVAAGLITDDFNTAMWLGAGWMVLAAVICALVAWRVPSVRGPVVVTFAVVAVLVLLVLGRPLLFDDEVEEAVVAGTPSGAAQTPDQTAATNREIAAGTFAPVRHPVRGRAQVIDLAKGGRVLTLTGFDIDNGPDLRVYLVRGPARSEGEVDDYVDLGALHGSKGNQQYEIPNEVDVGRHSTVVVWCRAFSALFARAPSRPV